MPQGSNNKFTERFKKVMQIAREEAARLQHDYIATEHLLLAFLGDGDGTAAAMLRNLGIDNVPTLAPEEAWTGLERDAIHTLPYLAQVSVPLGKVSLFLGSFSLLYLTVSTVTDEAYREQFFGLVTRELERAVGVRAVYLTLREQRRQGSA